MATTIGASNLIVNKKINKKNIALSIILSIITFGIYGIYWLSLLVKNIKIITKDTKNCKVEILCFLLIPFYSIYWLYTRGILIENEFKKSNLRSKSNGIVFLILGLLELTIVALAIIQSDFNSLSCESDNLSSCDKIKKSRKKGNLFTDFKAALINGGPLTILSFFVMGLGLMLKGQIVKGLLYLLAEVLFILFIVFFAAKFLGLLPTLGTTAEIIIGYQDPELFGTDFPIYAYLHNSFQILLFNVLIFGVILFFVYIWLRSISDCYKAKLRAEANIPAPSFTSELKTYLNSNFHVTVLSLPVLGVLAFTVFPLVTMILLAFTNFDQFHLPPKHLFTWNGFKVFGQIFSLGSSGGASVGYTFGKLLIWTFIWAICATFLNYIFGMVLALLINKKGIKFKKMWRTIFVTTIAVPQFVTLLLMSKILADEGIVNQILIKIGLDPIKFFTGSGITSKITVIVVNLWVGIPYTMLMTTGILMNIPNSLYESAKIDGASPFIMLVKITLPYMLFVTTPYLITQFVGNLNNFNVIYLLSGGGPISSNLYYAGETDLLITWLYKLSLNQQMYNLASAIGILIFVVTASLSLVTYNLSASMKREEEFQ